MLYHQAADEAVPPDRAETAAVADWPGRGWAYEARFLDAPDAGGSPTSSRADWPVSAALRDIGVQRGNSTDEADALGLTLPPLPVA
jgi:hypothetical protein